ncbi:MAG: hypothetical protein EXR71_07170 [Myxococcales bacterium]|nr:hypothetical protein [Myxococcales bacterium]
MILLLALVPAHAELPPPDYDVTLTEAAGAEVARIGNELDATSAETFARRWMRTFGPSARVTYELGLAWRLAGDDAHAMAYLEQAVKLDPDLAAARYDRGEVRLAAGDLVGATADFDAVVRLLPEAWPGWFRLAQLSGQAGDARGFERHLVKSLRLGFAVTAVAQDPTWRGFRRHATIGPVLERLVLVYQGQHALDTLGGAPG